MADGSIGASRARRARKARTVVAPALIYPGAVKRRATWGRSLVLAPGWRIVDVRGTPRIVDPLGWRVLDLAGDEWESRGGYSVKPSQIRALSKEGREWFRRTLANVRASDARIKARSTVLTLAQLNPRIAEREARIKAWASGGRKAMAPAPVIREGVTAACPANGLYYWCGVLTCGGWRTCHAPSERITRAEVDVPASLLTFARAMLASGMRS